MERKLVVQRLWVGPVITDITGVALARADRCPPTFSKSNQVQMSDVIVTCCHQPVSPSIDRPPNAIFPRIGPSLPPIPPNLLQQNTCGRRTNLHPSHWSADWTNRALEINLSMMAQLENILRALPHHVVVASAETDCPSSVPRCLLNHHCQALLIADVALPRIIHN